jgi:hypothetical protein
MEDSTDPVDSGEEVPDDLASSSCDPKNRIVE